MMTLAGIYRQRSRKWIFGVCSGLSEATGIQQHLLRASFILATALYPAQGLGAYLLITLVTRFKDDSSMGVRNSLQGKSNFTNTEGAENLALARDRLRALDQRLRVLEEDFTSSESDKFRLFDKALSQKQL